ncbi:MAG: integrase domain-containing protein [Betaproteobacteria bacterium]|nr:integrase domain-containing protein [Betaproteobacteria bacterium]
MNSNPNSHYLAHELREMCKRNRDGSKATQADRRNNLLLFARQLLEGGFRHMCAHSIQEKHVAYLVGRWKTEGIATGTIKNRTTYLRWWVNHAGKAGAIPSENAALGIPMRQIAGRPNKAQVLDPAKLAKVKDPYVRASVRLQAAFGLRREESIKIIIAIADRGNVLYLKGSWCKGGRERLIPIETPEQREVLNDVHSLAGRGSLIPPHRTYVQQRRIYDAQTRAAGLTNLHGLRHQYAQARLEKFTGKPAPKAGGPDRKSLTPEERKADDAARLRVSKELGHNRPDIVMTYCG